MDCKHKKIFDDFLSNNIVQNDWSKQKAIFTYLPSKCYRLLK